MCVRSKILQGIRGSDLNMNRKAILSLCHLLTKLDNFLIILDMIAKGNM